MTSLLKSIKSLYKCLCSEYAIQQITDMNKLSCDETITKIIFSGLIKIYTICCIDNTIHYDAFYPI